MKSSAEQAIDVALASEFQKDDWVKFVDKNNVTRVGQINHIFVNGDINACSDGTTYPIGPMNAEKTERPISLEMDVDLKNSWRTDRPVFAAKNYEFNFSLDAACSSSNTLVPRCYLTEREDALSVDWLQYMDSHQMPNRNVWVNPPYGRGFIQRFMEKAIEQQAKGVTTVMLVPATLDAQWFPVNHVSEVRIVTGGRLSFLHPVTGKHISGNTKGSMFVIFRPGTSPISTRFINRDELVNFGRELLSQKAAA